MRIKEKLDSGHIFIQNERSGLFMELAPKENLTLHFSDCSIQVSSDTLRYLLNEKAKEKNKETTFIIL